jgi:shikimate dehydrogenase
MKRSEKREANTGWWRLGLIGWPVAHSRSPQIHMAAMAEFKVRGEYQLYPVPPLPQGSPALSDLMVALRRGELQGLNITIPHKQVVCDFMDVLTESAHEIGAVNTIIYRDGSLIGENTDAPGFLADLERVFSWKVAKGEMHGSHALVLGAGGAARAVVFALWNAGWSVTVAARRVEQAESLISYFDRSRSDGSLSAIHFTPSELSSLKDDLALVVNATPLGMAPDLGRSPWPDQIPLPASAAVYDLVYNPTETRLLHTAREAGLEASNGLGMLVEQAALAFECWTGLSPSRDLLLNQLLKEEVQ